MMGCVQAWLLKEGTALNRRKLTPSPGGLDRETSPPIIVQGWSERNSQSLEGGMSMEGVRRSERKNVKKKRKGLCHGGIIARVEAAQLLRMLLVKTQDVQASFQTMRVSASTTPDRRSCSALFRRKSPSVPGTKLDSPLE